MPNKEKAPAISNNPASAPGALPDAATIPSVPDGHKAVTGAAKQPLLKVPTDQTAEIDQAMEELWGERAQLDADLGTLAPSADDGKKRFDRMKQARKVNQKVQALAAYTDEQLTLANHDVMAYLNEVVGDIEHMVTKNPQIAARYPLALRVVAQRRQAIADGMARAKAAKSDA